jgi:glycosyltransferase involved in cell wall biosynthesis
MRVAIANNQAPFIKGGAELLAEWLKAKLEEYGHQADVVRLPFQWNPASRVIDAMLAAMLVRLGNVDRVVAFKFPAYYLPHDNKVLWLLHQFRQVYDLWGTPFQGIPNTPEGHAVRNTVIEADRHYLPEAKRIYTNSEIVGHRLALYSGLKSEPLYPPLFDAEPYRCEGYGDYFFFPSRINSMKRQYMAIEAMARVKVSTRLVIAGHPDTAGDLKRLTNLIDKHGLNGRVDILPEWISDDEKIRLLSDARGVIYTPVDEDSYGYVTLEAFHARKPVITMSDSGGTLELVRDGYNGRVVIGPEGLAEAMEQLAEDIVLAERFGEAALQTISELDISWDRVIGCLTK